MIGIDYENMDDLIHLNRKDKLKIVKREIDKINNINDLLFNALQYNRLDEEASAYIWVISV